MWKTLDELPQKGQRVIVAAWEFGCEPYYFIAHFWQSSLPGQSPKFVLDKTYNMEYPKTEVGDVVRYWMPLPELPSKE